MFKKYMNEDPLVAWKQYGTIQNKNVTRRPASTEKASAIASKSTVLSAKATASTSKPPATSVSSKQAGASKAGSEAGPQNASKVAPPKLKSTLSGKGDIFASFSKAKPKTKPSETKVEPIADNDGAYLTHNSTLWNSAESF
jgi:DNA polymerase delta subunit 3